MDIEHHGLRREMILKVDRETAWKVLCDPRELATWFADEVDLEIREGGEGTVRWDTGEERHTVVEEVVEGRRVTLRWWDVGGENEPTIVEMTLDDVPEGTRLVVIEFPVVALRAIAASLEAGPGAARGPQMVTVGIG